MKYFLFATAYISINKKNILIFLTSIGFVRTGELKNQMMDNEEIL